MLLCSVPACYFISFEPRVKTGRHLRAGGWVWECLIDQRGRKLILTIEYSPAIVSDNGVFRLCITLQLIEFIGIHYKTYRVKISCFFLLTILFVYGCKPSPGSIRESLPGTWQMYDMRVADGKESMPFEQAAELKQVVSRGVMYAFFEDGTYTEAIDTTYFGNGTYKFSAENIMHLIDDSGKVNGDIILKQEEDQNGKQQFSFKSKNKGFVCMFIKQNESLKRFKDDPFYPGNNKWRIKPAHAEDTAQLKARLANYFRHIALILHAATERKQTVVSFKLSLGPLKIYDGGIGIYPYTVVPDSWKNCFFNEADAEKAYRIYEKYLETSDSYGGAATGNWFVDDYNILLTIYADFKKAKS